MCSARKSGLADAVEIAWRGLERVKGIEPSTPSLGS